MWFVCIYIKIIHKTKPARKLTYPCRHPSTSDRPRFREMVLILISDEEEVLYIPPEALYSHKMAGEVGAPLEAGTAMYPELEKTYQS